MTLTKRGHVNERSRIRFLQQHALADQYIFAIRGADLAAFRDERLREGMCSSTVVRELAIISHVFTTAQTERGLQ